MPLNKHFAERPRAFLMFTDLDGTFTPMDIMGKIDFVNVVKEIQQNEACTVKFIPVSGRPAGYVLRVLHDCRDMLLAEGISGVCEYGAAEQGAVLVNCNKTYALKYLGDELSRGLKVAVASILAQNEHRKIISDEMDKLYTCSIHILKEIKAKMSKSEQFNVYNSIKADVEKKLGQNVLNFAMSHNTMEVMSPQIKKSRGIEVLFRTYSRNYNIVGLMYAGDAENDKIAMAHVSRLAEVPGVNAHNFTPGNSQEAISTSVLEGWKRENPAAHKHYIEKGTQLRFKGITELIRNAMSRKYLTGVGVRIWETMDDCHPLHLKDLRLTAKSGPGRLPRRRYSFVAPALTLRRVRTFTC